MKRNRTLLRGQGAGRLDERGQKAKIFDAKIDLPIRSFLPNSAGLSRHDVSGADHLAPLLDFIRNELAEFAGRARNRNGP